MNKSSVVVQVNHLKKWYWGLGMLFLIFLLDQISKYCILNIVNLPQKGSVPVIPFFNFTMVWNRAITFGMLGQFGSWGSVIFSVSAFVIAASLFIWMIRARKIWVIMSLGAIVGGALGNILDRLRFGAVVDFIHFHVAGWSWYVFNVADSAIVCGVIILLMDAFFGWEE
ncbi:MULTISPECIES: signal peptidase II [Commensalibacter]|uniref:signal peptidase II n=1 Tax=Commensalibacter TaxID=1079922 RepID=UPI0012D9C0C0|nr:MULTISPECIES: signal peptidase II [Commensalibacter]MBH9969334.1 signal peptidase II [Commensalibacter sp. M0265]MBH9976689.1 signal peptidase II [Commensalibacter sp. M0266]MBH9992374.1 signal peptidase II [Commensalibacter sp. M0270]MBI0045865.1 signal peptidase II [Commensalibacter sp. M0267]MBI0055534.1 signal peptidase II [Commensalibacter sp. M0268]